MARLSLVISFLFISVLAPAFVFGQGFSPVRAQSGAQVTILDREGAAVNRITDGNQIRIRIELPQDAGQAMEVVFSLEEAENAVARCTIQVGVRACESEPFGSLGWHGTTGTAITNRTLQAGLEGGERLASAPLQVDARPVVMVHGFSSNWEAWQNYLGPDGFLASIGVPGFAVGDGQVSGTLNTGDFTDPAGRTNTIAQNAAILGEYIANVKQVTGAEQVDLLAHSMGGMISRYYIDRVMQERDVVQLLMLGSPSEGTDCANLPSSLGFYLPATLEIRPVYAGEIFNRQIIHRHGVPFYALAGILISNPVGSPCTVVPSDAVISRQSVSGVPLHLSEIALLHTELNTSPEAFDRFVAPLLQKGPGEYIDEPDPQLPGTAAAPLQFSQVFTGVVSAGQSHELTIPIDGGVTVASFALYDPSTSLEVTVRGASGNVIELDPARNGLIVVDDPSSLLHLGYGFANPNPGEWRVTLTAAGDAPASGANYALAASFSGGAVLQANSSSLLPILGELVRISARLELNGSPLALERAEALVRLPDGSQQNLPLQAEDGTYQTSWEPPTPGLYAIDVSVSAKAADGFTVERTAFLALEVQAQPERMRPLGWLAAICTGLLVVAGLGLWVFVRVVRRRRVIRD